MARVLIAYGTTEGQTRRIGERIAEILRAAGHEAVLMDCTAPEAQRAPAGFDAAILGGSLHEGRHQKALAHFAKANADWLNRTPSAFFSVSLAVASADPRSHEEAARLMQAFLDEAGWTPRRTRCVAGALRYTQYDFLKRFIMRLIASREGGETDTSRDYEYTDWDDVALFVEQFLAESGLAPVAEAAPCG